MQCESDIALNGCLVFPSYVFIFGSDKDQMEFSLSRSLQYNHTLRVCNAMR